MAVEYLGILYGLDDVSLQKFKSSPYCQSHHHSHQAEEWEGLMKEADDGDGSLTYEEFVAMISNAQMKN